jgi:micrococcal nuclease
MTRLIPLAIISMAAGPVPYTAIDGDSIRHGDERVRLIGIDAPEMPSHCRHGRTCAPGDPIASRDSLADLLDDGTVTVERRGRDRYGRTLANVRVNGRNVACAQIARGHAIYRADWDNLPRGAVARECGL